jgi:hypothetical protein
LGISLTNFDPSSDTAFPLNVNDSELSPDMESLPVAEARWTEMTLSLIKIETAYIGQRVIQIIGSSSDTMPSQSLRSKVLQDRVSHLENAYMRHCDENIPVQRATLIATRAFIAKMEFLFQHQQSINQGDAQQDVSYANEETLVAACKILEVNLQVLSDELLRGFQWHLRTYFQYHILTYIL